MFTLAVYITAKSGRQYSHSLAKDTLESFLVARHGSFLQPFGLYYFIIEPLKILVCWYYEL